MKLWSILAMVLIVAAAPGCKILCCGTCASKAECEAAPAVEKAADAGEKAEAAAPAAAEKAGEATK